MQLHKQSACVFTLPEDSKDVVQCTPELAQGKNTFLERCLQGYS